MGQYRRCHYFIDIWIITLIRHTFFKQEICEILNCSKRRAALISAPPPLSPGPPIAFLSFRHENKNHLTRSSHYDRIPSRCVGDGRQKKCVHCRYFWRVDTRHTVSLVPRASLAWQMRRCRTFVQITPSTFRALARLPLSTRFEILEILFASYRPHARQTPVSVENFGKCWRRDLRVASRDGRENREQ